MRKRKKSVRQPVAVLQTDPEIGLTAAQTAQRREKGWTNKESTTAGRTEGEIILRNLLTFFNLLFVAMAVLLAVTGSSVKNMTFMGVVVCNLAISCYQEIRAKRALDKLKLVAAQKIRTVRDGEVIILPSEELVRDDIAEFVAGDQICADGILLVGQLWVNEALITGEEDAVIKNPGDRLMSGSFVVSGKGRVRLTEVGGDAFAATLSREAKENPHAAKSEMMRSLERLIRWVALPLIPVGVALFCQDFYGKNLGLTTATEGAIAAMIGMIPQGLYLLTSIALAASSLKLTRDKVLVKDLSCIEALARVDVLCVDKTGTITEPGMEVEQVIALDEAVDLPEILTAFYGNIEPENDTAQAIARHFSGQSDWICQKRIPFTSETKWSAASFQEQGTFVAGAPEFVLGERYCEVQSQVELWSKKGSRVLLIARAEAFCDRPDPEKIHPLGLVVLSNRIRASAPEIFSYFAEQGVTIKVISGDNPLTVSQVALRAGVANAEKYVDASTLETEAQIAQAAVECSVFGRVTPDKKRAILWALKAAGHTVAMTGDGVNDVLALKEADCSVAMASGAQAANQVSQLVLTESDFAAMPAIVDEGRRVINNIQRAAALFLVKNILALGLALILLIVGQSFPFQPAHFTLISALTVGMPSFFLAMEPNYDRVSGKFLPTVLSKALPGGLTNLILILLAQMVMPLLEIPQGQITTACVAIMGMTGMTVLYRTCRPFSWFRRLLWWAMGTLLIAACTLLGGFFGLSYGNWRALGILAAFLAAVPGVFALLCLIFRRKTK